MTIKTLDGFSLCEAVALNYKRTLPKTINKVGVAWTIETYAKYVSLYYPHISVSTGQEWGGDRKNLTHICEYHGEYQATPYNVLKIGQGSQCRKCSEQSQREAAGKKRRRSSTPEERALAKKLYEELGNYAEVGRRMGRTKSTILVWLDPKQRDNSNKRTRKKNKRDRESGRSKELSAAYYQTQHGRKNSFANDHKRRALQYTAVGVVFMPEHPDADYQGFVEYDFWDYLETTEDRELFTFEGADEDVKKRKKQQNLLGKISGEPYSLEHLIPLSKGGIHHPLNFANRALTLNLEKNNKMLEEDIRLFTKRLFG